MLHAEGKAIDVGFRPIIRFVASFASEKRVSRFLACRYDNCIHASSQLALLSLPKCWPTEEILCKPTNSAIAWNPPASAAAPGRLGHPRPRTRQKQSRTDANVLGVDGLSELCHPLGRLLPRCADPDMALNNLERYLSVPARRGATLMKAGRATLETVLQLSG